MFLWSGYGRSIYIYAYIYIYVGVYMYIYIYGLSRITITQDAEAANPFKQSCQCAEFVET